jgi:hypothetical protein
MKSVRSPIGANRNRCSSRISVSVLLGAMSIHIPDLAMLSKAAQLRGWLSRISANGCAGGSELKNRQGNHSVCCLGCARLMLSHETHWLSNQSYRIIGVWNIWRSDSPRIIKACTIRSVVVSLCKVISNAWHLVKVNRTPCGWTIAAATTSENLYGRCHIVFFGLQRDYWFMDSITPGITDQITGEANTMANSQAGPRRAS